MAALEQVIARAYDFGALSATSDGVPLYRSRGWQLRRGPAPAACLIIGFVHAIEPDTPQSRARFR